METEISDAGRHSLQRVELAPIQSERICLNPQQESNEATTEIESSLPQQEFDPLSDLWAEFKRIGNTR